ncbi:MAG: DHHA1 domain-containing protein [Candidatus Nanoarchaeia archaeon]
MLTKKQVNEIRDLLNNSNNPLFLFDNDPDGLCSFLLLQKYTKRGKGFPVRSFPDLNETYFRKITELNPDCLFILDKPLVSESFFKRIEEINLPVVWIDHHKVDKKQIPKFVNYYNPLFNKNKSEEPVTTLCYQVNNNKDLVWLAVVGSISDRFFPKFYKEFKSKYPDLAVNSKEAFEIFYNSQIGKIARIFSFALKDSTTNVISMIKFLIKTNTPYEVLEDSSLNHMMHKRFEQIDSKYQRLIKKAVKIGENSDNILFFQYAGELSISSDISNELSYRFPKKVIVVAYISGLKANISVRGNNIREKVMKSISMLNGATGGGHENAVGAQVRVDDLKTFRKTFENLVEKN